MNASVDPRLPAPIEPRNGQLASGGRPAYGDLGYPMAPTYGGDGDGEFDFKTHLRIVLKRKKLIAAVTLSALAIGYLWFLTIPPVYTATVRVQVDPESKILEKGGVVSDSDNSSIDYQRTQLELLQSRNMAERVAAIANLSPPAEAEKPSGFSLSVLFGGKAEKRSGAAPPRTDVAVGAILGGRAVKVIPDTRLFDLSFTDASPQRAQIIANAFGEAFINFNLDKRLESNAYAKTFLDDQIKQLKIRLQDAERAMIDFAQKEQLIASSDKDSKGPSNYEQVKSALSVATAERIRNELQWKQVEAATAINLPQLLTNATISQLRAARGALTAEYQEKSTTYGPNYPAMVEIKNKLAEIDRQLASEVKTIKASFKAAYEASLAQEQELKKQVESTRVETLDTQKRSIQYNILRREVETTRALYESLLQRFKEVDVASGVGVNNVFIVDKAELPGGPSYPIRSVFLRNALIAGLIAGLGLAYLLEWLDDVVHSSDEAERISGLAALGIVPKVKNLEAEMSDPRSGLSEAYRSLCTTLQLSTAEGLPKALLFTSSMPGEGKSFSCLMVARQFAAMGMRTLLIDADLRNASLHTKLSVENACGLSNYLTSGCTPSEAIQRIGDKQPFFFMASGPLPPNSAELLGSQRMHYLIDVTTRTFDIVIVDGPPVMGLADAPLLTRSVKATVFVVAAGQTRKPALESALKRLTLARTHVIGLVLTKVASKVTSYGYGYGYGYGPGPDQLAYQAEGDPETESDAKSAAFEEGHDFIDTIPGNQSKPRAAWLEKLSRLKKRFSFG
ncbi:tyrosine-protein kinase Etk/Wzc [freshwater sediment metagenome]|uniref:Tyrosine-protein kinase Etk/Wzc n=1 Tax=freshwater sediment metagenome TaxID=556182 RepID=A0AA48RF27_9ZZZZ